MHKESNRKSGGYPNQPAGRKGNALANTDKAMNRAGSDLHLSDEDTMRRHAPKQKAHMDSVERRKSGDRVGPNSVKAPVDESKPVTLESEEDDVDVVIGGSGQAENLEYHDSGKTLNQTGRLIVGLRVYDRNDDGTPLGMSATSQELLSKHRQIRREKAQYIDQDGTHVRVGELTRERKGKHLDEPTFWGGERTRERRVPGVIRSILGRLMPHEGEIAGEELTQVMIEEAMDEAVSEFQKETGCEIISAAAHRMANHDLHIHIQYTMVVQQQKKLGKYTKERKKWRDIVAAMAREALLQDGVHAPNPSAVRAMIKRLRKAGKLDPEPEFKILIRKVKGLRFMGSGSILGHCYRHKLNIVSLAEEAKLPDLAERVIEKKDELGGFRPIAERSDEELEGKYLDLWLERTWRRIIKARLSKEGLREVRSAGVLAARSYADFGAVKPKQSDLERTKVELMYKEAELGWERQFQEMEEAERLEEIEQSFRQRMSAMVKRLLGMRQKINLRREKLRDLEESLEKREEKVAEREAAIQGREEASKVGKLTKEEVGRLHEKAYLYEELLAFVTLILDSPGLGLLLRKRAKVWERMKKLAPEMGLQTKVGAIDAVKKTWKKKSNHDQDPPNSPGDLG